MVAVIARAECRGPPYTGGAAPGLWSGVLSASPRVQADDAVPVGGTPQQFAAFLKNEAAKWGKVIRKAGITLEQ